MKKIRNILLGALVLASLLAAHPAAAAWYTPDEWGLTVYGNTDIDVDEGDLYSAGLMLGFAKALTAKDASARLDFRLEGQVGSFWDYGSGAELAILPGLRLYLGKYKLKPYLEGGIGPSYNFLDIEELGIGFNFLSYGGVGVRYELGEGMSLDLGYRLRHISNAGMSDRNHGVTSNQLQFGLNWSF